MQIPTSSFSVGVVVVALYAVNLWLLRLGDPARVRLRRTK